jgi:hypothetical protein
MSFSKRCAAQIFKGEAPDTLSISPGVDMTSGIFWFTGTFSPHDSLLWITALSMMGYNAQK